MLPVRPAAHTTVDADPNSCCVRDRPIYPCGIARTRLIRFHRNRRHIGPRDSAYAAARVHLFDPNVLRCEQGRLIAPTDNTGNLRTPCTGKNAGFV